MRVILAQPRGFCAGVVRAIDIVEKALDKYGEPVYVRHEIVHNKHVVDTLKNKGARFVEELDEVPEGAVTVFSAHGVPQSVVKTAEARGLPVLDATCPLVSKVHNQGKRYVAHGRTLILIGHAGHPEVEGTMGQVGAPVTLVQNEAELSAAAAAAGAVAVEPDADGVIRRLALAVAYRQTVVPSFALEVVRIGGAEKSVVIDTGSEGVEDIRIGGTIIPTDRRGRAILHFMPPIAPSISASDVLDPAFDPAQLEGQVVLLGVAGQGIAGFRQTPLGLVRTVDLHAQLIESILLGNLLRRPPSLDWFELAAGLGAGLVVIWLLPYARPVRAAGLSMALVAILFGVELALFRFYDLLFDSTFPALTVLAAFGVMLVASLRAVEEELRRHREATQRLEGELAAAQAIQMGLLPRQFPAFPDRPEIDVYARIEPARMVGGDLYDYLLIDHDHRLFFAIADVSGKGAPAALLMATTKEIIREAAVKFGAALDRILTEANQKTTAANVDLQPEGGVFVTAFVGVLDLQTGDVAYASAGHDSPFILGGSSGVRQLTTDGGPPLGAIEAFPYPIDHDRLEPGEVLLLYTDGVTEAENANHALYGRSRLAGVLASTPAKDARDLVTGIFDDVRRFVGEAEAADDITVLALRRAVNVPVPSVR